MNAMFTGLLFGCAVAAPVGPIGLLCLRRTLAGGFLFGFASGLGAACADGVYAALAIAALHVATLALTHVAGALQIIGGGALIAFGVSAVHAAGTATRLQERQHDALDRTIARAFTTTFALTIVNPATIVSFAAVTAASGTRFTLATGALFVLGVTLGSSMWWLALSGAAAAVRRSITPRVMRVIDLVSGAGLIVWGVWSLLRA